ncbi:hypothetical protein [Sphingomonas sp. NBWT7]|uniref:hypothetical protein n=1 Tax=Sphingomonas sp. NBWT7 TaxID=2596913 RepID=UPI001625D89E|nr:hypothetical protein [Sphingomonas sp. NBWT7]
MHRYAFVLLAATPLAAHAQTAAPAPTTAPAAQTAPAAGTAPAATASAAPTVGATIYDAQGGVVGTIASTDGTSAVVDTGANKAAVPLTSFGTSPKGPTLGMTKAELDAAAGQATAQATADFKSKLVAGTTVYGTGGASLGTIKTVDAQFVTLTTPKGDAKIPVGSFGPGAQGVTIGMTAAQLQAAMGGK